MEPTVRKIDFEAWMAEEQARIFLLCLRLLHNRDEADSATQDVFVEAYRTLQKRESQPSPPLPGRPQKKKRPGDGQTAPHNSLDEDGMGFIWPCSRKP